MRVIKTLDELAAARRAWAQSGTVGFVPTMGYLHAGHLSLAQRARAENDITVVSIFLNPTQFGPSEDLSRYPRDLPHDLALLERAQVDAVFTPTASGIYPAGFSTYVEPTGLLAERLEAATRPGHYRGVATVVAKLFLLVAPRRAYFGQKDAQQVAVIRQMIADLNMPISLRVSPTVREADGLAMSSRNAYLNAEQRVAATVLSRALEAGRVAFERTRSDGLVGAPGVEAVKQTMVAILADEPAAALDYADVCHPDTFAPLTELAAPALLAIAAKVGSTRLIDNFLLRADGTWDMGARLSQEP
ncbi:MAG TPA: pantoate--beta-alanine ligase [Ktedonobacterales bacterium]|nr:pantoate--beta-alanine ligase [Ktedonobacterales bacterium]